jgi:hypothetical protein
MASVDRCDRVPVLQELCDCIGWDKDQFSFFSPKGFMTTEDYPYNLTKYPPADPPVPGNPCRYDAEKTVPGSADGFFNATTGNAPSEDQMAAFIHHNGPGVCIALHSSA